MSEIMSAAGPPPALKSQSVASPPAQPSGQFNDQQSSSPGKSFGGSFAGASSHRQQGTPRGGQNQRSKHRNHKKPSIQREDFIAEANAMASSNSRKGRTSITHLIDWSLPPRPQQRHYGGHHHSHGHHHHSTNRTWGMGSGYHAVDKARYVNANYRFIVNPNGDYRAQQLDPDSHIPWNSVLQILASAITQTASCPICLSEPTAPRMAKCGHIFCLPCLIRYMDTAPDDDKHKPQSQVYQEKRRKWKKCPICYDSIYMAETRAVKFYTGQETAPPTEGSDVVLRLMMRKPGSTLALPKDVAMKNNEDGDEDEDIPWYYAAEVTDYARVMKGTENYMNEEYQREIGELEEMERIDELMYGEEGDWAKQAIRKIKAAMEEIKGMGQGKAKIKETPSGPGRQLVEEDLLKEAAARAEKNENKQQEWKPGEADVPDMYMVSVERNSGFSTPVQNGTATPEIEEPQQEQVTADVTKAETATTARAESPTKTRHRPERRRAPNAAAQEIRDATTPYFFYQALPHSYLHPLDIRILKSAFGSFAAFPSTVLPRLENFSTRNIVDDDLRKRAKYMSHLPHGCEVAILECDWTDIVPAEILEKFRPDLEKRVKKKKEKEAKEERDRIRAEREEEDKRFSAARLRRRYPGDDDTIPSELQGDGVLRDEDFVGLTAAMSVEDRDSSNLLETQGQGKKIGFDNLPQSSPPSSRTVWGTPAVAAAARDDSEVVPEPPASNAGGWLADWEKDLLLQQQEYQSRSGNTGGGAAAAAAGGGGGKGKKKFKKVTLLSNQGNRGA